MNKETFEANSDKRFEFGKNWCLFLKHLNNERIKEAEDSLCEMLELQSLEGKTFLDVGCGSGLFSLAAMKLGAKKVYSFDFDPKSVECAQEIKQRYFPEATNWKIERGSILDIDYIKELGRFDIVYSWGVLHHTGDMWKALENVIPLTSQNGKLFIAIYNDQGGTSQLWKKVKILYNKLPAFLKPLFVSSIMVVFELKYSTIRLAKGKSPFPPKSERGMKKYYDWIDWVGGYPFEVAKPEEIFLFFKKKGFVLEKLKTVGGGLANNEFVFSKTR